MRSSRKALAAAILTLSACMPGATPPRVAARGGLDLGGAPPPADRGAAGPPAVIFAGPRGETAQAVEISVIFNKPMRALGLGPADPPPPAALRPAVKGAFHWIGSAALRFDAEEPFAPATAYHVEITAGARALDGSTLAEAYGFDFTTPRANLIESDPKAGDKDVRPDTSITLAFDEAVGDAEIARAVTIRGEKAAAPVPFEIRRQDPARVELVPARPLPLADRVHVKVDASLRAEGGELPAGKDHEVVFATAGPPSVRGWVCQPHPDDPGACNPDAGWLTLDLAGEVPADALARAVRIDPPARWDRSKAGDSPTGELFIDADFKPGVTYRVRLAPDPRLVDWTGQRLAPDPGRTLRFGHRPARANFGLQGVYWSAKARHSFPARVINASDVVIHAAPRSLDDVLRALGGEEVSAVSGPAVTIAAPRLDEVGSEMIHLDKLLPNARGAVELIAIHTPLGRAERRTLRHPIQITDLGLSARVGLGGAAVLVTGLDDGRPAAGAEIALYRVPRGGAPVRLGTAVAGATGEAAVSFPDTFAKDDKLAVVGKRGDDWTALPIEAPRAPEARGSLFTERGLYRPGETVKVSGVIRVPGPRGLTTPKGTPLRLTVLGPGRDPRPDIAVTLSDFGTFSADVPIPREAALGTYRVRATAGGYAASTRFFVSEYRPTEIAVEAAAGRRAYQRGEVFECAVKGRYLHGAPMARAQATVVISRSPTTFTVPGHEDFMTGEDERSSISAEIYRARTPLDARGALTVPAPLSLPGQTNAEHVSCAVEVMDLNRQALSASDGSIVHPGALYAALKRPDPSVLRPGASAAAEVVAVTPAGDRRRAKVHVEVIRRAGDDGVRTDTPIAACDVTTGLAPARCAYTVPADSPGGSRVLVRASVTDDQGRLARAGYTLMVEEPPKPKAAPPPPPPPPPPPERSLRVTAEPKLKVGDTGHIKIESPFTTPATALVTIEREGILWQRVVPVPGLDASLEFPVTEAMIPGADVAVMIVSGERSHRSGASFQVDAAPKKLDVKVEVEGASHRPGEAIDVDVRVKDARGAPARAEVTLWAADEGTLSLIGYRRPDPHEVMFDFRRGLVTEADSRDALVRVGLFLGSHRVRSPSIRMGATMVSPPRGDFRQTAFFAAHLVTDGAGRLRRRFTLPDGLTTYRVMAVAATADDRFGSGEASVVTSLPLMARATLPRVVRAGDRFEASVVVSGADLSGDVEVRAEATGATLGASRQVARVEGGAPAEVRFPVTVDRPGSARLTFRAAAGDRSDAVTLAREVVPAMAPEAAAIDGEVRGAAAEQLGDLSSVRPDYGGLEIALSTTPLAGLAGGVEQLVEYPYGCTEQTVSRLVPLLALRDLAAGLGAAMPGDTQAQIDAAVARVVSRQQRDGSFGLWRESARGDADLTAWALFGLGEARRRGARVPPFVEARARAYLAARIAEDGGDRIAAFVADLDALDGRPDREAHARLFAAREALPAEARASLLHAMALSKDDPAKIRALAGEAESLVRLDGAAARVVVQRSPGAILASDTRATALLLRALVAAEPAHPLIPRLARGLLESRRRGRFRTTHDAAWALLALDDLRRARPSAPQVSARVFLGDTLIHDQAIPSGRQISFGVPVRGLIESAGQPLTFAADGPLYYHATLRFAPRELPAIPAEGGMILRRALRSLDDTTPAVGLTFHAGDLVLVQLDLITPSPRSAVVVDAPLPGGFEPADADLRLGGSWIRRLETLGPAVRRELRDDRVVHFIDELPAGLATFRFIARASTPGTFVTPPARAEEMYAPDTFARTAAETTTVLPR